jgi:TIR domain
VLRGNIVTVFISHDFDDKALYYSLCLALDSSNIRRYDVSKLSPGEALTIALRSAIEECDHCVFIATPRSLKSAWCLAELGAFWGAGKRVIVYQGDPLVDESVIPPQFRGNLWTADAKDLLAGIMASAAAGVRVIPNGYSVNLVGMVLNVTFGRMEECGCVDEASLIALPASEFFDDECFHDPRSALGAFMQRHFKNEVTEIQDLVKVALDGKLTQSVEKTPGRWANSYGTGTCIFLNRPLSSNFRIVLVDHV